MSDGKHTSSLLLKDPSVLSIVFLKASTGALSIWTLIKGQILVNFFV